MPRGIYRIGSLGTVGPPPWGWLSWGAKSGGKAPGGDRDRQWGGGAAPAITSSGRRA